MRSLLKDLASDFDCRIRISAWSIKCDVMFYISQVVLFETLQTRLVCHKLSRIPFHWLWAFDFMPFCKLLPPPIYGYTLSPLSTSLFLFLASDFETFDKTNQRCSSIKAILVFTWRMSYVNCQQSSNWPTGETVSGINLLPDHLANVCNSMFFY